MKSVLDGQESMFALVTQFTKTSPEPSPQTEARIGKRSSRNLSGSSARMPLMCLCLTRGGGPKRDASTTSWEDGPLPIGCMTLSIGEFRKDADGLLSLPISTDSAPPKFCLTLNCGEKPRIPNPTKLSEILEPDTDPKYRLSALACQGILNRAERRGKELPKALLDALTEQAQSASKNEPGNQGGQRTTLAE